MGGHDSCYLVTTGDDGNTYWAYCKKYSDAHEKSFKAQVAALAGRIGSVHRKNKAPDRGIEITFG